MNSELRERLLGMAEAERRLHVELAQTGELFKGYVPRLEELHRKHALELEEIIAEHGWPGEALLSGDGARAAWVIAQHGISLPDFLRRYLVSLKEAVDRGEAVPAMAAYLEDKIHFCERRPQRYGTQFDWDEHGQLSPWTLEDPARVEEFRKAVGLGPLAVQIQQFRRDNPPQNAPQDWQARQAEKLAWARSVGWIS